MYVKPSHFIVVGLCAVLSAPPLAHADAIEKVMRLIESSYVEEIDREALEKAALVGLTDALDPHSSFLPKDKAQTFAEDSRGRFGGVGVEVIVDDGRMRVVNVFPAGPAGRAGVRPGDIVRAVDGLLIDPLRMVEVIQRLRGEPGQEVRLTLLRGEPAETLEVQLVREVIRVKAVAARLLPDNILYVALRAFQSGAAAEVRAAYEGAARTLGKGKRLRGMLLDLRNNAGGLVDESTQLADLFLRKGVIVSTQGRGGRVLGVERARSAGTLAPVPLVVLVNRFSASAAEIVAGALQDHGRAILVGTRTFGKGSVQELHDFGDLGALKLTIARYLTPKGRIIQARGIVPDFVVPALDEEAGEALRDALRQEGESTLDGHLAGSEAEGASNAKEALSRDALRRAPDRHAEPLPSFPGDFQAQIAHQLLKSRLGASQR